MCTRFVCRGDDTITGFNFDIAVWNHKIIKKKTAFISASCDPMGCAIPTME